MADRGLYCSDRNDVNLKRVELPVKIICKICEKALKPERYSQTQLNELRWKVYKMGRNYASTNRVIKCRLCTPSQQVELECITCLKYKAINEFSSKQRSAPEFARCKDCVEISWDTEPGRTPFEAASDRSTSGRSASDLDDSIEWAGSDVSGLEYRLGNLSTYCGTPTPSGWDSSSENGESVVSATDEASSTSFRSDISSERSWVTSDSRKDRSHVGSQNSAADGIPFTAYDQYGVGHVRTRVPSSTSSESFSPARTPDQSSGSSDASRSVRMLVTPSNSAVSVKSREGYSAPILTKGKHGFAKVKGSVKFPRSAAGRGLEVWQAPEEKLTPSAKEEAILYYEDYDDNDDNDDEEDSGNW